mmetsp:Transcript_45001/g.147669  ORF Transcript_45001/g.147669 Transcript_45001/m.147669 type:complete len:356 (-) Transcript_45001:326-1393(-)
MRAAGSGGANLRAALRCLGADRAPRIVPPRKTKIVERQLPLAHAQPQLSAAEVGLGVRRVEDDRHVAVGERLLEQRIAPRVCGGAVTIEERVEASVVRVELQTPRVARRRRRPLTPLEGGVARLPLHLQPLREPEELLGRRRRARPRHRLAQSLLRPNEVARIVQHPPERVAPQRAVRRPRRVGLADGGEADGARLAKVASRREELGPERLERLIVRAAEARRLEARGEVAERLPRLALRAGAPQGRELGAHPSHLLLRLAAHTQPVGAIRRRARARRSLVELPCAHILAEGHEHMRRTEQRLGQRGVEAQRGVALAQRLGEPAKLRERSCAVCVVARGAGAHRSSAGRRGRRGD